MTPLCIHPNTRFNPSNRRNTSNEYSDSLVNSQHTTCECSRRRVHKVTAAIDVSRELWKKESPSIRPIPIYVHCIYELERCECGYFTLYIWPEQTLFAFSAWIAVRNRQHAHKSKKMVLRFLGAHCYGCILHCCREIYEQLKIGCIINILDVLTTSEGNIIGSHRTILVEQKIHFAVRSSWSMRQPLWLWTIFSIVVTPSDRSMWSPINIHIQYTFGT